MVTVLEVEEDFAGACVAAKTLRASGWEVTVEDSDEIPNPGKNQPGDKVGACNTIFY